VSILVGADQVAGGEVRELVQDLPSLGLLDPVTPGDLVAPERVAPLPLKRVPQGPVPVLGRPWEDADVGWLF